MKFNPYWLIRWLAVTAGVSLLLFLSSGVGGGQPKAGHRYAHAARHAPGLPELARAGANHATPATGPALGHEQSIWTLARPRARAG
jgi:hypothetical protein